MENHKIQDQHISDEAKQNKIQIKLEPEDEYENGWSPADKSEENLISPPFTIKKDNYNNEFSDVNSTDILKTAMIESNHNNSSKNLNETNFNQVCIIKSEIDIEPYFPINGIKREGNESTMSDNTRQGIGFKRALTPAERQRRYREKLKSNIAMQEKYKEKDRLRKMKTKKKKILSSGKNREEILSKQRKEWRESKRRQRQRAAYFKKTVEQSDVNILNQQCILSKEGETNVYDTKLQLLLPLITNSMEVSEVKSEKKYSTMTETHNVHRCEYQLGLSSSVETNKQLHEDSSTLQKLNQTKEMCKESPANSVNENLYKCIGSKRPLTSAERQRRYREKLKTNIVMQEKHKEKERLRKMKTIRKNKIISRKTLEEILIQRKEWRERKQKQRQRAAYLKIKTEQTDVNILNEQHNLNEEKLSHNLETPNNIKKRLAAAERQRKYRQKHKNNTILKEKQRLKKKMTKKKRTIEEILNLRKGWRERKRKQRQRAAYLKAMAEQSNVDILNQPPILTDEKLTYNLIVKGKVYDSSSDNQSVMTETSNLNSCEYQLSSSVETNGQLNENGSILPKLKQMFKENPANNGNKNLYRPKAVGRQRKQRLKLKKKNSILNKLYKEMEKEASL